MDPVTKGPVVNASLMTTAEGIFACGNVLHVHDLVDNVSKEAEQAGLHAAEYIRSKPEGFGEAVRPKIPEKSKSVIPEGRDASKTLICIGCPKGCMITVDKKEDGSLVITGNSCRIGENYARNEMTAPKRGLTSMIRVEKGCDPVVPVKTKGEIPKGKIEDCMEVIRNTTVTAPVKIGEVLIRNVADTGVDIVATATVTDR